MKILVVNIKYLGDLIISTPSLRSLRKKYPDSEIVILVRKEFQEVLKHNPNVDRILSFDPKMKGNRGLKNILDGIRLIKKIRKEKFDVVIVLHPGDRVAVLSWLSGAKVRIAPKKQSYGFLFNYKVDVYEDSISYLEYYNKIISSFDVPIDSNETEFFISKEDEKWAEEFFNQYKLEKCITICIHPGASEPTKIWPAENFIELITMLRNHSDIKIILISGPMDKNICEKIVGALNKESIIYFCSNSILKTAALIKKCSLLLTHDTGTRHLSVALRTPVLALLPNDNSNSWNFYSSINKHYSIIGNRIIAKNSSHLGNITAEDVYKKIGEILSLW